MADFAGFVGDSYAARSPTQDAQECINLYPEIDQRRERGDGRGVIALYPTPGKVLQFTLPDAAEVRALYTCSGSTVLIAVCGASVYNVTTGMQFTHIGTLGTTSGPVSIDDNGVWAMLCDGAARYVYNWTTGQFTTQGTVSFTGSIAPGIGGGVMTVTAVSAGVLGAYLPVNGAGVSAGQSITSQASGTPGGIGTYNVSVSQTLASEALTATDGGFSAGGYVAEVDGHFIYTNPGTQEWGSSSYGSPTSPNVPPAISYKDGAGDNLISMICNNREIYLLGERTAEVWIDQGSFPFPFARLPGTNTQHGCVAPYSVARLGEFFAWLSRDTRGIGYVYYMNGYVPVRISTYAVENAIAGYAVVSDARAYTYMQGGHEFYVLTFPTADVTWVYDFTTQMWHKRAWRDSMNVLHRDRGNCSAPFANQILVGDWQNGNVYSLSLETFTDNGDTVYRMRRAQHITENLYRVFHIQLQIQFQPGVGINTGQGSNPQAMLQWSDDGGFTWSAEHWTQIGKVGAYLTRAMWRRLGWSRDRIYQVVMSDPVPWVIVSVDLITKGSIR